MQVSVETPGGLQRRMRVSIPAEDFEQAIGRNLKRIGQNARVDGFRPGKVPTKVIRQRYGARARQDALSDLLESSYPKALEQAELTPAGQPQIEFEQVREGEDLAYVATFDVYPDIELKGIDGMAVEVPETTIEEADVDKVLQRLREQRKTHVAKDGAAEEGDKVTVDFVGSIDGVEFEGGKAEGAQFEVGAGRFLKDLEDGVVGMAAGDTRDVTVAFPEDYQAEQLKGKTAVFAVTMKAVETSQLPEIDEEFCKAYGAEGGDEASLRERLKDTLERERDGAVGRYKKRQVMDNILDANDIEVPGAIVEQEIERMRHEAAQRYNQGGRSHEELHKLFPDEAFAEPAKRRSALGLLVSELIKSREIKLDADRVEAKLKEIAADFEDSEAAINYYRGNAEFMQGLRAMVLEDQVVDACLANAKVSSVAMNFDDLTQKAATE